MSEKKTYVCEYCETTFAVRGNYYRHKKYMCSVKIEEIYRCAKWNKTILWKNNWRFEKWIKNN
jgi:hypothetical protein